MPQRLTYAFAALALVLAVSPRVLADDYVIDGAHTSVIFGVSHLGYSFTYGRFDKASGNYSLDAAHPEDSKFQVMIDASSVDTNDAKRDEHLKGPDFFNAGQFPVISFQSSKIAPRPEGEKVMWDVTGDLTIHGVTKPITLPMQKLGEGPGMGPKEYRSGFICQTKVMRTDFGMTNMVPMVGDEIAITVSFEGIRQGGGQTAPAPGATGALKPAAARQFVGTTPLKAVTIRR